MFDYQSLPIYQKVLRKISRLEEFALFFGIDNQTFHGFREFLTFERLKLYIPVKDPSEFKEQYLKSLINKEQAVSNDDEQLLINLYSIFFQTTQSNARRKVSLEYLSTINQQIYQTIPDYVVRDMYNDEVLNQERKIKNDIEFSFNALLANEDIPPLIQVWILYVFLDKTKFFRKGNTATIRQFCYDYLINKGVWFYYPLELEKYIFQQKENKDWIFHQGLKYKSAEQIITSNDMKHFITMCLNGLYSNLQDIEIQYKNAILDNFNYKTALPIHKNFMNYWMNMGLVIHKSFLKKADSVCKDILYIVFKDGATNPKRLTEAYGFNNLEAVNGLDTLTKHNILEQSETGDWLFSFKSGNDLLAEKLSYL